MSQLPPVSKWLLPAALLMGLAWWQLAPIIPVSAQVRDGDGPRPAEAFSPELRTSLDAALPLAKELAEKDKKRPNPALRNGLRGQPVPSADPPAIRVRFEGVPNPGARVALHAEGMTDPNARLRWVQTAGPAVLIERSSEPDATFTVPEGSGNLSFLLVFGGYDGLDCLPLNVPIQPSGGGPGTTGLLADAGDDQFALVGRQVTLNASRSSGPSSLAFRWIQTGGPPVRFKLEDRYVYSFVPNAPGIYRFAVVVAAAGAISQPDEVAVTVGASGAANTPAVAPPDEPATAAELAQAGLSRLPGGRERAEALANAFEDIADRIDLYGSYNDLLSEFTRRLETIVPEDPALRGLWNERLFSPLTAGLLAKVRAAGLDLSQADARAARLSFGQKASLAEEFRNTSSGFRALVPGPSVPPPGRISQPAGAQPALPR